MTREDGMRCNNEDCPGRDKIVFLEDLLDVATLDGPSLLHCETCGQDSLRAEPTPSEVLADWLRSQGLPLAVLSGPVSAQLLLRSPSSLTPTQRAWLQKFVRENENREVTT
jgi:hypothetical protein